MQKIQCVGVYRVMYSGNRIPFQVEWKQNSVSSGVETEFCFKWSGNRIPFRCLGNGKFWCIGNGKFWCLRNGKFWCPGKNSFGVSETEFRFCVTRKWMFCFLVFFCAYILTYYGWRENKIFEREISCRNGNKISEQEISLHIISLCCSLKNNRMLIVL